MINRCRSCGASILWARTSAGKTIPLDAEPDDRGNVLLEDGRAEVLSGAELKLARESGGVLHLSHFATCPHHRQWKKS